MHDTFAFVETGEFGAVKEEKLDPPIICETTCKPVSEEPVAQPSATSFIDIDEKICTAKGGGWNTKRNACDHFIQATTTATPYGLLISILAVIITGSFFKI